MLAALFFMNNSVSEAQGTFWSPQERIPEYQITNYEQPPYMIADQNHVVHAFNAQSLILDDENSPKAIVYRQWTLENGWTYPNDILYDETGGDLELVGVSSDQAGMVHLVYQKNFDDLYYTNAYLADAGNPLAWSVPVFIDGGSLHIRPGIPNVGAIANDNTSGQIVIVFSGAQYGNGLYYTYSSDNGLNWTNPYPIYLTGSANLIVSDPKLYMGDSGVLHLVWATINEDGSGGPGYYSSFDMVENSWREPEELDIPGIDTPSVIEHHGDIFVSYYHKISNSNWMRRSDDLGITWTPPIQISPNHVGTNGNISFVVDSSDTLHGFFGERINAVGIHGMWHLVWRGNSWTDPDPVVTGPQIKDDIGGNGFDPKSARAVVLNGNTILVTWGTDGVAGQNGAWYSYIVLDTPELPSQPLPRPSEETENALVDTPTTSPSLTETDVVTPDAVLNDEQPVLFLNPQSSILLGIAPALLLLVGFIITRYLSRSGNS